VVKVTLPDVMDFKFYRFSPRMLVSEALKKIKERKRITSVPQVRRLHAQPSPAVLMVH
jgi:hypothetical protein